MIRIFKSGPHIRRSPLTYPALAGLFGDAVTEVTTPEQADLYLFAHLLDVQAAPETLVQDWRARRRPVVVLSEEPFWDTIWGKTPLERAVYVDTSFGTLPVVQLSHQTSDIFHFDRIPYYLLTNHRFANAYRWRFRRNAARSAQDWRADFDARKIDLTFMFERRPERFHNVRWPKAGVIGLCAWRTDLAAACTGDGIERLGQGWQQGPRRQDLVDWHMDKLTRLDGRSRSIGALENTHQREYITEKLFDAFACGARPLYFADPHHRLHELGLPSNAWLNLYGLSPSEAAEQAMRPFLDASFLDGWHQAQVDLAALFGDTGLWVNERVRLKQAVITALETVLADH